MESLYDRGRGFFIYWSGRQNLGPGRQSQQSYRPGEPPGHISLRHQGRAYLRSLGLLFKITVDTCLFLSLLFYVSNILSITGSSLSDKPELITEQASNVSFRRTIFERTKLEFVVGLSSRIFCTQVESLKAIFLFLSVILD